MFIRNSLILILTLIIPRLSIYGVGFISYADPFIITRDLISDRNKISNLLFLYLGLLLSLFLDGLSSKIALCSLIASFLSETLDFLLTFKIKKMIATLVANILDPFLFLTLCHFMNIINQLNYNLVINILFWNLIYIFLFQMREKKLSIFKHLKSI